MFDHLTRKACMNILCVIYFNLLFQLKKYLAISLISLSLYSFISYRHVELTREIMLIIVFRHPLFKRSWSSSSNLWENEQEKNFRTKKRKKMTRMNEIRCTIIKKFTTDRFIVTLFLRLSDFSHFQVFWQTFETSKDFADYWKVNLQDFN